MDAPAPAKPLKINRLLPYWAVFQADIRQTLQSWIYRSWVLIWLLAAIGFLIYQAGIYREAHMVQLASSTMGNVLRWSVLGSIALIVMLTASSISSDRGTLADSVLCRGISRYQYFMAKWHARLVTVIVTFSVIGALILASSFFLLHDDLSLSGSIVALLSVSVLLATVITCGVTFSAVTNNTLMGITVLWLFIYGIGFTLSLLPPRFPSPDQTLSRLTFVLQGKYDLHYLGQLALWSGAISGIMALVGIGYFAQRDV